MAVKLDADASREHVAAFLEKIGSDRDAQLMDVEQTLRHEVGRIIHESYQASRKHHRQHADTARKEQTLEHERTLSRARADIRRQGWNLLQEVLGNAMWTVEETLRTRWRDADEQVRWVRYWLNQALTHADGAPLQITLGQETQPAAEQAIKELLAARSVEGNIEIVAHAPRGVVVEWLDSELDGTLASRLPAIEQAIFEALTDWMHADDNP